MKNELKTEYYYCTRLRVLDFLQKKGFEFVGTAPYVKNPKYTCWLFPRTPEVLAAVDEYYSTVPVTTK